VSLGERTVRALFIPGITRESSRRRREKDKSKIILQEPDLNEEEGKMFRTMLVDDNPYFRKWVKDTLKSQFPAMDIVEAADGVKAFQEIDSYPPNVIFMDIRLAGGNVRERIRKIKSDYPDIMIIILTIHDLPEYREAATRYGAEYFLSKSSIATDEISALGQSVLLEKGFSEDGSNEQIF
jgi:DNA-binding NarL/FixJ family response regulator